MKEHSNPVLLLLLLILHLSVSLAHRQVYIVRIEDHRAKRTLVEIENNHFSYLKSVKNSEEEAKDSHLYSYKNVINGFSALLTPDEADKLSEMDGVVSVIKSEPIRYSIQTTRSWEFTNLLEGGNSRFVEPDLGKANYGKDVIVGVLDTGVWPESQSFSDEGMDPVPQSWKGTCQPGVAFNSSHCNRGYSTNVEKGLEVRRAGGLGFILQNPIDGISITVDAHVLPGTAIFSNDSDIVLNYIKSNKNATARIVPVRTVVGSKSSPFMAGFSSTGPNALDPNILKPDITAPGLNIMVAWSEATSPTKLFNDNRVVKYNILSGTSMSCPHVAAAAALIKAAHLDWSSAAIRSALMTTATQTNNMGLPIIDGSGSTAATPFHYGSGHFQPAKALNPGLIYDANYTDYLLYLCTLNSSVQTLDPSFTCPNDFSSPSDLNYPSVTVSKITGNGISVKRTVTNVGGGESVYKVSVEAPVGYTVEILPEMMKFSRARQTKSFRILIRPKNGLRSGYAFGWYTWSDGIHRVRSPIVVSP